MPADEWLSGADVVLQVRRWQGGRWPKLMGLCTPAAHLVSLFSALLSRHGLQGTHPSEGHTNGILASIAGHPLWIAIAHELETRAQQNRWLLSRTTRAFPGAPGCVRRSTLQDCLLVQPAALDPRSMTLLA